MKMKNWEDFLRLNDTEHKIVDYGNTPWEVDVNLAPVKVYKSIEMVEGMNSVTGYSGFIINILFDENDNYLGIGAWE